MPASDYKYFVSIAFFTALFSIHAKRISNSAGDTKAERMPLYVFAQNKLQLQALKIDNQDQSPLLSTIGLNDKSLKFSNILKDRFHLRDKNLDNRCYAAILVYQSVNKPESRLLNYKGTVIDCSTWKQNPSR